jgi:tripartite-type tricarboxylate transporter receptor subunit TctC
VFSINAALFKDLRYNPVRDFAPITLAVTTPNVLITKPGLAANSMKELVDYAKKNPGKLSYCSSGTGSSDHLTAELLNQVAGISAVHVPYKGGAACQTDIMGGQVDISFQNLGAVTNYIRGNRMKALAVTAKTRNPQLPNVPTTAEGGFPELVVTSWQAAAAPAKTPREIVARLNDATVKALRAPDVRERMSQIGFDVVAGTPEEFGRFMKEELERWTEVVKRGGIKPE